MTFKTLITTVSTAGQPVQLTPIPTKAWWARIEKVAGSGNMFLGESGLNRTTLAKVGKVFSNTNPPDFIEFSPMGMNMGTIDLSTLWIDADSNNRSLITFYIPW